MVALTIRNIDPDLKRQIKKLAVDHDRSTEAEAHELLKRAAFAVPPHKDFGQAIRDAVLVAYFEACGVEIVNPWADV